MTLKKSAIITQKANEMFLKILGMGNKWRNCAKTQAERLGAIKSQLEKLVYDWAQKNEEMEKMAWK